VRLGDGPVVSLRAHDVACFPQGDVHVLASEAGLEPLRITAEMVAGMAQPGSISRYRHRGKGVKTRLICGFFACDRTLSDQLIAPLPRLLTFEVGVDSPASLLAASAQAAAGDGGVAVRPGSQAILCKLSELLFVDARLIRWRRPIGRSKRSLPTPGLALPAATTVNVVVFMMRPAAGRRRYRTSHL
jgi:AraC family transcriptional regulator, alkane utilization regulator